jgi:hypothetical protein
VRHTQPLRETNFVRRSNAVGLDVASEGALKPNPSLTPLEVVEGLLQTISNAPAFDSSLSDIEEAFAFVSPEIIERNQMDVAKFKMILETAMFDGILGCTSWEVLGMRKSDDSNLVATLKVWPAPMPDDCGCYRCQTSELKALSKMPLYFKWDLCRLATEPYAGCWMLNQMSPTQRPKMR